MSTDWKLFVRLHTAVLRQESMRHLSLRTQHHRLDNIMVRQLGSIAVPIHTDDGFRFRFH